MTHKPIEVALLCLASLILLYCVESIEMFFGVQMWCLGAMAGMALMGAR